MSKAMVHLLGMFAEMERNFIATELQKAGSSLEDWEDGQISDRRTKVRAC